jgi:hypothetical protein
MDWTIGELADSAAVNVETIRYYDVKVSCLLHLARPVVGGSTHRAI